MSTPKPIHTRTREDELADLILGGEAQDPPEEKAPQQKQAPVPRAAAASPSVPVEGVKSEPPALGPSGFSGVGGLRQEDERTIEAMEKGQEIGNAIVGAELHRRSGQSSGMGDLHISDDKQMPKVEGIHRSMKEREEKIKSLRAQMSEATTKGDLSAAGSLAKEIKDLEKEPLFEKERAAWELPSHGSPDLMERAQELRDKGQLGLMADAKEAPKKVEEQKEAEEQDTSEQDAEVEEKTYFARQEAEEFAKRLGMDAGEIPISLVTDDKNQLGLNTKPFEDKLTFNERDRLAEEAGYKEWASIPEEFAKQQGKLDFASLPEDQQEMARSIQSEMMEKASKHAKSEVARAAQVGRHLVFVDLDPEGTNAKLAKLPPLVRDVAAVFAPAPAISYTPLGREYQPNRYGSTAWRVLNGSSAVWSAHLSNYAESHPDMLSTLLDGDFGGFAHEVEKAAVAMHGLNDEEALDLVQKIREDGLVAGYMADQYGLAAEHVGLSAGMTPEQASAYASWARAAGGAFGFISGDLVLPDPLTISMMGGGKVLQFVSKPSRLYARTAGVLDTAADSKNLSYGGAIDLVRGEDPAAAAVVEMKVAADLQLPQSVRDSVRIAEQKAREAAERFEATKKAWTDAGGKNASDPSFAQQLAEAERAAKEAELEAMILRRNQAEESLKNYKAGEGGLAQVADKTWKDYQEATAAAKKASDELDAIKAKHGADIDATQKLVDEGAEVEANYGKLRQEEAAARADKREKVAAAVKAQDEALASGANLSKENIEKYAKAKAELDALKNPTHPVNKRIVDATEAVKKAKPARDTKIAELRTALANHGHKIQAMEAATARYGKLAEKADGLTALLRTIGVDMASGVHPAKQILAQMEQGVVGAKMAEEGAKKAVKDAIGVEKRAADLWDKAQKAAVAEERAQGWRRVFKSAAEQMRRGSKALENLPRREEKFVDYMGPATRGEVHETAGSRRVVGSDIIAAVESRYGSRGRAAVVWAMGQEGPMGDLLRKLASAKAGKTVQLSAKEAALAQDIPRFMERAVRGSSPDAAAMDLVQGIENVRRWDPSIKPENLVSRLLHKARALSDAMDPIHSAAGAVGSDVAEVIKGARNLSAQIDDEMITLVKSAKLRDMDPATVKKIAEHFGLDPKAVGDHEHLVAQVAAVVQYLDTTKGMPYVGGKTFVNTMSRETPWQIARRQMIFGDRRTREYVEAMEAWRKEVEELTQKFNKEMEEWKKATGGGTTTTPHSVTTEHVNWKVGYPYQHPPTGERGLPRIGLSNEAQEFKLALEKHMSPAEAQMVARIADARAEVWAEWRRQAGHANDDVIDWWRMNMRHINMEQPSKDSLGWVQRNYFDPNFRSYNLTKDKAGIETAVHELGHIFRFDMNYAGFGDDLRRAERIFGVPDNLWVKEAEAAQNGTWLEQASKLTPKQRAALKKAEEDFANYFTLYVREGRLPIPEMKPMFDRLKEWLYEVIWGSLGTHRPEELSDDMRKFFHDMIDEGRGTTKATPAPTGAVSPPARPAAAGVLEPGARVRVRPEYDKPVSFGDMEVTRVLPDDVYELHDGSQYPGWMLRTLSEAPAAKVPPAAPPVLPPKAVGGSTPTPPLGPSATPPAQALAPDRVKLVRDMVRDLKRQGVTLTPEQFADFARIAQKNAGATDDEFKAAMKGAYDQHAPPIAPPAGGGAAPPGPPAPPALTPTPQRPTPPKIPPAPQLGPSEGDMMAALQSLARVWLPSMENIPVSVASRLERDAINLLIENSETGGTFLDFMAGMRKLTQRVPGVGMGHAEGSLGRAFGFGGRAAMHARVLADSDDMMYRAIGGVFTAGQVQDMQRFTDNEWSKVEDFKNVLDGYNRLGMPLSVRTVRPGRATGKGGDLTVRLVQTGKTETGSGLFMAQNIAAELDRNFPNIVKELDARYAKAQLPEEILGFDAQSAWISTWKKSVITGLIVPNPRYWLNNIAGDFSQMWFELGPMAATKQSFQNLPLNFPIVGQLLQDFGSEMALRFQGKPVLGSVTNALFNPWINRVWNGGKGLLRTKYGQTITYGDARRWMVEDGILDTFIHEELPKAFSRVTPPWYEKAWNGWHDDITSFANLVQQRQRSGLYLELLSQGYTRDEARRKTLAALFDWKHGIADWELRGPAKLIPFYRFWRLALKQMTTAFTDPLLRPSGEQAIMAAFGQSKLGRVRAQAQATDMVGQMGTWLDPELQAPYADTQEQYNAIAKFVRPTWARERGLWYTTELKEQYVRSLQAERGRVHTHAMMNLPPLTALDSAGMIFAITEGLAGGAAAATGVGPSLAPDWEQAPLESVLGSLVPQVREPLEAYLTTTGLDPAGTKRGSTMRVSPGEAWVMDRMFPGKFGETWRDPENGEPRAHTAHVVTFRTLMPVLMGGLTGAGAPGQIAGGIGMFGSQQLPKLLDSSVMDNPATSAFVKDWEVADRKLKLAGMTDDPEARAALEAEAEAFKQKAHEEVPEAVRWMMLRQLGVGPYTYGYEQERQRRHEQVKTGTDITTEDKGQIQHSGFAGHPDDRGE